jgi:hypothetical protein
VGLVVAAIALTVGVTGCGDGQAGHRRGAGPFAWLRPAPPPAGWRSRASPGDRRSPTRPAADWSWFRADQNRGEGSRHVRLVASANELSFRSGRGSCVIDSYTNSKAAYREIACLVAGPNSSAVVVATAPADLWHDQAATLQRAVSSFVP